MAEKRSNKKNVNALITLLEDPDKEVFEHVFQELTSIGNDVIPKLESEWEESQNPLLQGRIENLIHNIQFQGLKEEFEKWANVDSSNLLYGAYLVSRYIYPELNFGDIRSKIDIIKQDIWLEINEYLTALERVKVFNHIIYSIHRFYGDSETFNQPKSSFIGNLLSNKKGNSIALGILYLAIAKELDIPIYGVNLPHHFILAYVDADKQNLLLFDEEHQEKVLFYINPFNEGAIFTEKEIGIYLEKLNIQKDPITDEFAPNYFEPIGHEKVIEVLLSQLIASYQSRGQKNKMEELEELLNILKQTNSKTE